MKAGFHLYWLGLRIDTWCFKCDNASSLSALTNIGKQRALTSVYCLHTTGIGIRSQIQRSPRMHKLGVDAWLPCALSLSLFFSTAFLTLLFSSFFALFFISFCMIYIQTQPIKMTCLTRPVLLSLPSFSQLHVLGSSSVSGPLTSPEVRHHRPPPLNSPPGLHPSAGHQNSHPLVR